MLISELFTILPKSKHSASYGKSAGKYPFFTSSNTVDSFVDEPDFDGEYLIIGDGGTGNSKYINGKFSASDHNYVLSPRNNANPRAVNYFLKKDGYRILNEGFRGIGIKNVSKSYIESIDYRFNSKFAESQIVANLDKINFAIDLEKQVLFELDSMIKSRFNELLSSCKFREEQLTSLANKITDGSHNPPRGIFKSDYIMASSQNIFDTLDLKTVRYLSKEDFIVENKRTNIQKGDLLFTIVGTIGRSYVVKNEKMVFQRSVAVIKPRHNLINSTYLKYFLSSQDGTSQINKMAHGVAQKGIYLSDLKNIVIKVPDINKQNEFAYFASQVDKLKFINKK